VNMVINCQFSQKVGNFTSNREKSWNPKGRGGIISYSLKLMSTKLHKCFRIQRSKKIQFPSIIKTVNFL
jgi:hypothetical protein